MFEASIFEWKNERKKNLQDKMFGPNEMRFKATKLNRLDYNRWKSVGVGVSGNGERRE